MGFIESGNGSYIIQPVVEGAGPNSPHIMYNLDDWFLMNDLNHQVKYDGMYVSYSEICVLRTPLGLTKRVLIFQVSLHAEGYLGPILGVQIMQVTLF